MSVFVSFDGDVSAVFVGALVVAVVELCCSLAVGGRLDDGLAAGEGKRRFVPLPEVDAARGVPPVRGGTGGVFPVVDGASAFAPVGGAVTVTLVEFTAPLATFPLPLATFLPAFVPPPAGRLSSLPDMITPHWRQLWDTLSHHPST